MSAAVESALADGASPAIWGRLCARASAVSEAPRLESLNASECVVHERWRSSSGALCEWPLSVHWLPTPAKLNAWVAAARQRGLLRPGGRVPSYMH